KGPGRYDGSGSCCSEKRPKLLRLYGRQKNRATFETTSNSAQERKSFGKKSVGIAAGRENVCIHRNIAFDDTRRSDGQDRGPRRPRHWQCAQENRLRGGGGRGREQSRQGERPWRTRH